MNKRNLLLFIIIGYLFSTTTLSFAARLPKLFPFEKENSLKEWEEKIFKGRVIYSLKMEHLDGYLSAYSDNSASGLFCKVRFDPKEKPFISWKWKVVSFPDKEIVDVTADNGWLEKDDYAARFYVIFPRLSFAGTKSLEYVWDEELPVETIMTSPYFKNIKIIVAESGKKNLGKWIFEKRNVLNDYEKAFGRKPGKVGAIAIMTDTDNTISTAEAYYDEIKVGYTDETK